MGIFSRRHDDIGAPAEPGVSLLDAGLVVRGDLETDGSLRIEGRLEGSIRRAAVVVLGARGAIVGNVTAREVIVAGTVHGNVVAEQRAELQPGGTIRGDVQAGAILVTEGANLQGRLTIAPPVAAAESSTARTRDRGPVAPALGAALSVEHA